MRQSSPVAYLFRCSQPCRTEKIEYSLLQEIMRPQSGAISEKQNKKKTIVILTYLQSS